jgi:hypothetical protein
VHFFTNLREMNPTKVVHTYLHLSFSLFGSTLQKFLTRIVYKKLVLPK